MKTASSILTALLATGKFYVVDLFQFTLVDGTVLRYAAADQDITDQSGNVWASGGFGGAAFQGRADRRGLCSWKIGTAVDTLQFDVLPGNATVEGFPIMQAVRLGFFDGAECILYRGFMATYGDTTAGLVNIFTGRVVEVDCGCSLMTFNINSHLELLNYQMPRNMFQPGCLNKLYDGACTMLQANFTFTGTDHGGSTASLINLNLAQATGYFNLGVLTYTSGQNSGFKRSIKAFTAGSPATVQTNVPFPFVPAMGDTFSVYPGCDKTQATCVSKFNNGANFRGQRFIPQPETGI